MAKDFLTNNLPHGDNIRMRWRGLKFIKYFREKMKMILDVEVYQSSFFSRIAFCLGCQLFEWNYFRFEGNSTTGKF